VTEPDGPLAYSQNPRPVGFPVSYKLAGDRLKVDAFRGAYEVNLGEVTDVRLTYEPGSIGAGHFKTKLRLSNGRTLALTSVTWTTMVQSRSLAPEYRRFIMGLIDAVVRANPQVRLAAGKPRFAWTALAIAAAAAFIGLALFTARAFATGATGAGLFALVIGAAGYWQIAPMIRLNRPRPFEPGTMPVELLG
jgi:hypothetical protein